jgi:D-alanyl-D-alanine dipeptidase
MKNIIFLAFLCVLFLACSPSKEEQVCTDDQHAFDLLDSLENKKQLNDSKTEQLVGIDRDSISLIDIQTINPAIRVELKYATADNFMQQVLYSKIRKAYLQKDVAIRLGNCQKWLTSNYPGMFLLVYDAVRPLEVQQRMWNALDSIPVARRVRFVSNPANHSLHNYGAAIDLTICDGNGKPLDMGAGYDDMREIAYPKYEAKFIASGQLSNEQVKNRTILRRAMQSQQFRQLETEWWHFNACSRSQAKSKYTVVKTESEITEY